MVVPVPLLLHGKKGLYSTYSEGLLCMIKEHDVAYLSGSIFFQGNGVVRTISGQALLQYRFAISPYSGQPCLHILGKRWINMIYTVQYKTESIIISLVIYTVQYITLFIVLSWLIKLALKFSTIYRPTFIFPWLQNVLRFAAPNTLHGKIRN
jgi:hypothetical protein